MAGDALWPYVAVSFDPVGANGAALGQADNRGNVFVTQAGSPVTSTSWAATGGVSAWFNGAARAQCANVPALNFGAGDFEISFWMLQTARTSPWACVLGFGQDSPAQGWRVLIGTTGQIHFNLHSGGYASTVSMTAVPLNMATHISIGRASGSDFIRVNGVAQAITGAIGTFVSFGGVLQLSGTLGPNWLYTGHLDRLEILSGVARHPANFTPETSAFVPYAGQVSGVIRDSANALCARTVRAYRRDTGALVGSMTSDAGTGAYSFNTPTLHELNIIALDDAGGTFENDLITRAIPA